ncbi:hypothetical protein TNIN_335621 [Trichonephila inaurata madagascariensis]|uniref:Uncharacterized protein n=1 Tax=Trichonephila inaurata madagascariensis TaxID=2747483 RepID=A0A8X6Y401_9ARAC|nr:hypothetical protein TNIN_335621 [Trichonephila inaurata madagascariensis]
MSPNEMRLCSMPGRALGCLRRLAPFTYGLKCRRKTPYIPHLSRESRLLARIVSEKDPLNECLASWSSSFLLTSLCRVYISSTLKPITPSTTSQPAKTATPRPAKRQHQHHN